MYAFYALHKFNIPPGQFARFSIQERAFIIASINEIAKAEEDARRKIKK